ncbi:MAG: hypothetical protein V4506_14465 [Bacteroidota bacterium]
MPTHVRIMNTNILSNLAHDIRNEGLVSNLEYNAKLLTQIDEVNNGGPIKPIFARNVAENARHIVQAEQANRCYDPYSLNNDRGPF